MIYLDSAATTKPLYTASQYGYLWMNSNMLYAKDEKDALETARETIKKCLNVSSGYVLFFRCATEAVQWLSKHFYCSCKNYEHDSVYDCQVPSNSLYSMHYKQLVNQLDGHTNFGFEKGLTDFVGSDYTAGIGKVALPKNADKIFDAIWYSSHKIYAESVGVLWISDAIFKAIGGTKDTKNQYGLVHGTLNVPAIVATSKATEWICKAQPIHSEMYDSLGEYLNEKLHKYQLGYIVNNDKPRTKATNLVYLWDINADALQSYCAIKGCYFSIAASACSDDENRYRVANAIGLNNTDAEHCVRISFGIDTTKQDIDGFIGLVKEFSDKFVK